MTVTIKRQDGFDGKCSNCGCEFEYQRENMAIWHGTPGIFYVNCPNCGQICLNIWHNDWYKK